MPRPWLTLLAPFVLAGLLAIGIVAAQEPSSSTGDARIDPAVRVELDRTVAGARAEGLPTEPLIDKALEGTAKGAAPARIIRAITTLAWGLSTARAELGGTSSPSDLVAGAEALRAGVQPDALAALRRARPAESLLTPLVVLADLISRGVPAGQAAEAVVELATRAASDADFNAMQQAVQRDIEAGAPPGEAVAVRSGGRSTTAPGPAGGAGRGGGAASPAKPPKPTAGGQATPESPSAQPPRGKPPKNKPPKGKPPTRDRPVPDRP